MTPKPRGAAIKDETGKEMKNSFTMDTASRPRLVIIQPEESRARP